MSWMISWYNKLRYPHGDQLRPELSHDRVMRILEQAARKSGAQRTTYLRSKIPTW